MGEFLLIAAAIVGCAFAANILLNVLSRSGGSMFVGATFAVIFLGAYAASFVLDMIMLAWTSELPTPNIIWPSITWSLISYSLLFAASGRRVPFTARAIPFWIIGGIAMLSSFVHARNVATAIALLLGGTTYASLAAQKNVGVSENAGAGAQPNARHSVAPTIGPYHLNMKTADVAHLVELTQAEKKALNTAIAFKNEQIFHAPAVEFAGVGWDIILGAVAGSVYKVSALVAIENRAKSDGVWTNLKLKLESRLGPPADSTTAIIAWDTDDGNVVLNRAETSGTCVIALTITSQNVSSFVRIK
jgi:hypothetical protein